MDTFIASNTSSNLYMGLCLELARRGVGQTSPNPLVGAVIVKDDTIIGRGYHKKAGSAHAEIEALKNCMQDPRGSTLYVNLETCAHRGKTPPCTDAIIRSGIRKVVVGMIDPNPRVCGKGIETLEKAGITLVTGVCEEECRHLNRFFSHWITHSVPYIIAKAAVSADWKIAKHKGVRTQITGAHAQEKVHELRQECDAILVGIDTVIIDDPLLTARCHSAHHQPLRIILDSRLRIPLSSRVLSCGNVFIAITDKADPQKKKILEKQGIRCEVFPKRSNGVDLHALLAYCGSQGITSILVEGGARCFDSFIEAELINEWQIFQSEQMFGPEGVDICSDLLPLLFHMHERTFYFSAQ